MRMRLGALAAGLTGLLLIGAATSSGAAPASRAIDDAEECLEPVPERFLLPTATHKVVLDVHVVLDDVPFEHGIAAIERAQRPYADLGIELRPTYEQVSFEPDAISAAGSSIDPRKLMELTRLHLGGYRPHTSDVVYTITSKELVSSGVTGGATAGQADCIGGVRYPNRAFAVGEAHPFVSEDTTARTAKIATHEIGHLLGAHHHYANCAEGDPDAAVEDFTPCTVMINDIGLLSMRFSTAEAGAVRGHALAYANDTPEAEPVAVERELTLAVGGDFYASGTVTAPEEATCTSEAPVVIQRRKGKAWVDVAATTTLQSGTYDVAMPARSGRYRAVAAEVRAHTGEQWVTCTEATSPPVRVR